MKALSLKQPMAWAIFHGKDVENRTWPTKFRGRVYIHASQGFDRGDWSWLCNLFVCGGLGVFVPARYMYVHGVIIGEVDIIDCQHYSPDDLPRLHSDWAMPGQYQFVLANPGEYDKPIPCKGMLKFFTPKFEPEKHRGNDEKCNI